MAARLVRQRITDTTADKLKRTLMVLWLFRIPMAVSLASTRCAISIFFIRTLYTRVFPWLRYVAYMCIIGAIAVGFITIVTLLLHCRPMKYNYTMPFENLKYCYRLEPFVIVMASLGVALDALTWLLPYHVVWRLQLRLAHRIAITVIFAFGLMFKHRTTNPETTADHAAVRSSLAPFASTRCQNCNIREPM